MNYTNNAMIIKREESRIEINNKFHAQKYITIPKINIFKKSDNNSKSQKRSYQKKKLSPQDNSLSHQSITGTKRSCDFHNTNTSSKSSKELQHQNDFNKKLKNSEGSSRNASTSKDDLAAPSSSCSSNFETSDVSRLASVSSQRELDSSFTQRRIPRLRQTEKPHCSTNTKSKGRTMNTSQHKQRLEHQSKAQKTSVTSPDSPESTKRWTRSQTPEQQLEIMKYWLDKYYKNNRFDPAISDLTSGKPWNEIEGKLLSRFMPVFKKYLLDHGISSRTTEFYFLFFTALRDKHKIVNNDGNSPDEITQDDD